MHIFLNINIIKKLGFVVKATKSEPKVNMIFAVEEIIYAYLMKMNNKMLFFEQKIFADSLFKYSN